jgi:hypothetical protein
VFSRKKFELIVPVFFGCLASLFLSASLMKARPNSLRDTVVVSQESSHEAQEKKSIEAGSIQFLSQAAQERSDAILELYRDSVARERVIDFFAGICPSKEIAEVILINANLFDIPPALAFSLAWEESRFNHHAVNSKNRDGSIDRGLFQLNNRSFPRLEMKAFYNANLNAWYGMSHLRYCMDEGGSEVAALAMYNAGTGRVNSASTPKSTLDYASRILQNRWEIESRFRDWEAMFQEQQEEIIEFVEFAEIAEAKPERSRLVPLVPLASR